MILRNLLALLLFVTSISEITAQVNPCISQNAIRVVVLGSSTAAGAGPSTSDSAWVNRYRNYLTSINPNNEVINLAVGGFTTYRIMRTGFVPPPSRPTPNTARNITAALALNPDAIIVNLPSNDVSSGYTYQEQIDNLDSIVELATIDSVPIWICTTQPKNSSTANMQLQWDIKDTILVRYAPRTIDFWTTIALPDNSIDPTYDSGDGTHLNDAGHNILASRVIDINIPLELYTPTPSVDYAILDANPQGSMGCGDSSTLISVVIANLGIDETISTQLIAETTNLTNGMSSADTLTQVGGMLECDTDTLTFTMNTYEAGNYSVSLYHTNSNDTISANDSLTIFLESIGHPTIFGQNDTLCESGNAQLSVATSSEDTVFWYQNPTDLTPIGYGTIFSPAFLTNTTTWYAEAIRGDLFYRNSVETTLNSNINFNGAMLDIVALDDLIVDSFYVKINSLGMQEVEIFTRAGTHIGNETNAAAWTLLGSTFVDVLDNQSFTSVPLGDISLSANDTLGVYIHMALSSSNVSYASMGSPATRSTPELEIITGSGIAYNFSNSFYPRDLNCGVHYHFGDRPEGECSSGRIPVTAFVNDLTFDLGNDTIVDIDDTITFNAPVGYVNYSWSTGSNADSTQIIASTLGNGIHTLSVSFQDSLGCERSDSLIIAIADLVSLHELSNEVIVYPNPTSDELHFSTQIDRGRVFSPTGTEIMTIETPFSTLSLKHLSDGNYFMELLVNGQPSMIRFVKESHK